VNSTSLSRFPRVGSPLSDCIKTSYLLVITFFLLFSARIFTANISFHHFPEYSSPTRITMGSTSPPPPFPFHHNRPIDTPHPLKIGIIGAGISGIALSIRLHQYIPSASITIWEKNPDIGGTWFENRYPEVKCDIPSHVYQYTFEPNSQWGEFFVVGRRYWSMLGG
jgi:hypothetical protein